MNNKQIQITKEGLEALQHELTELVDEKRPRIVARLERARNEGDLSENSDYNNAKEELEFLDGKIDELKHVVDNAVIVAKKASNGEVAIGTTVTIQTDGDDTIFEIVGEWEADPASSKISHESPIGSALIGKKVGDTVEVEAPVVKIIYTILEIK